mgnify:CR=1 FL=1
MSEHHFANTSELDAALAQRVAEQLNSAINERDQATLVLSGGSTPKGLFAHLSKTPLAWDKVTILLADERWVAATHADSNERLVREALLTDRAASAKFLSLVGHYPNTDINLLAVNSALSTLAQFDVVILGMGTDGHTASLFPCAAELEAGLTTDADALMVTPTTAPHQRISLSKQRLRNTALGLLHIVGDDKREVLTTARNDGDKHRYPILNFVDEAPAFEVWWAPKN